MGERFLGLQAKFALLLLLPCVLALTSLVLVSLRIRASAGEAELLNHAGLQRAKAAQLAHWAEMVHGGQDEDREGMRQRAAELESLITANRPRLDGSALADRALLAEFEALEMQWRALAPGIAVLATEVRNHSSFDRAFEQVRAGTSAILAGSDHLLQGLQQRSERARSRLVTTHVLSVAASLLLLAAGLWLTRRHIAQPLIRARDAALKLGRGDFAVALSYRAQDEVGELSRALDDTARRLGKLTAELDSKRQQAQAVVKAMPVGVVVLDGELRVTDANLAFCSRLNTCCDKVRGRPLSELLDDPGLRAEILSALTSHAGDHLPTTCDTRDGKVLRLSSARTDGATGSVGSLVLAVEDLTAERRLQRSVAESEQRFRAVCEHHPDGLALLVNGQVTYTNDVLQDLLVCQGVAAVAERLRGVLPAAALDPAGEALRGRELTLALGGGVSRILVVDTARIGLAHEDLCLVHVRDVTERRQLALRTAQLDRLVSIGTLAAGVAHEINNPLTYVLANLELLAERLPDVQQTCRDHQLALAAAAHQTLTAPADLGELDELLRDARDGARRVQRIVRDLKSFSRTGDDPELPVELGQVIEVACNMAFNEVKHSARLEKELHSPLWVNGSSSKLGQVFINLIVNAAHACQGGVEHNRIRVRLRAAEGAAVVEISDTGSGIAPEHLPRLFEPFFTTKPVGQGTGLGLAISRQIALAHGGDIVPSSEPGQGATFIVRLPLISEPLPERAAEPTSSGSSVPDRGRVLVIDDEPLLAAALARNLRTRHHVDVATSGSQALSTLDKDHDYDLILCDLMMPDLSGMALFDQATRRFPEIAPRFVFCTGGAFSDEAQRFLATSENQRIDKPIDMAQLRALVQAMVKQRRPAAASSAQGASGEGI